MRDDFLRRVEARAYNLHLDSLTPAEITSRAMLCPTCGTRLRRATKFGLCTRCRRAARKAAALRDGG